MSNVSLSWDVVTLDDTGSPVTVVSYSVYRDGVVIQTGAATSHVVNNETPGPHVYEFSATSAAAVEGAKSAPVNVTVPSGIPAAPQNGQGSVS